MLVGFNMEQAAVYEGGKTMKKVSGVLVGILSLGLASGAHAGLPGENYCRVKGKAEELKNAKKVAIITFNGNTVITGGSGMGTLVSGAVAAAKSQDSKKMTLDQKFVDETYDMFVNALKSEGYDIVPVEQVLAAKTYQESGEVRLPSTLDAKGLKSVNLKKDAFSSLAAELGVDRLVTINSSHGQWSKFSLLGDMAGKVAYQAGALILVFDKNGKRVLMVDAKQTSDTVSQQVAGGFQDPGKVVPMIREADKKLVSVVAAELSKK